MPTFVNIDEIIERNNAHLERLREEVIKAEEYSDHLHVERLREEVIKAEEYLQRFQKLKSEGSETIEVYQSSEELNEETSTQEKPE
jgi:predicted enzyme involved in methoxymalonyl-ACP biosynthesis